MDHDFDSSKNVVNHAKHGVSLEFGVRLFEDPEAISIPTIRLGDEEERFKLIGSVDGKLWTAIHVWRDDVVRFISVRRSNATEQRIYHRHPGRPE